VDFTLLRCVGDRSQPVQAGKIRQPPRSSSANATLSSCGDIQATNGV